MTVLYNRKMLSWIKHLKLLSVCGWWCVDDVWHMHIY